jgi:hypothetical protein
MEQINLNKENPVVAFKLNAEDSSILIHRVSVSFKNADENQWPNFLAKINLTAELNYEVWEDTQGRFIDERSKQFPIHLQIDAYQSQPVFLLNQLIKNETFTIGVNSEPKFYRTLKLVLHNFDKLEDDYTLAFNIEKFKIED